MLSYQHAYHAGGPADVHKHALLWALLAHLRRKDKPFTAVDLYAGEGLYDLARPEAQKVAEYRRGIERLWARDDLVPPLAAFRDAVRTFNTASELTAYPGSPALLQAALRPADRLLLNELHPAAVGALRRWSRGEDRIAVHQREAAEAIKGLLPPPIRRGIVLVDPSYEDKGEYAAVAHDVRQAHARWPEAIIAVWYPRLADGREVVLLEGLRDMPAPTLHSALDLDASALADGPQLGLRGSGMIVIHPPWEFDATAAQIGDQLAALLGQGPKAGHRLTWITPER